jgi:hypothetical protein
MKCIHFDTFIRSFSSRSNLRKFSNSISCSIFYSR